MGEGCQTEDPYAANPMPTIALAFAESGASTRDETKTAKLTRTGDFSATLQSSLSLGGMPAPDPGWPTKWRGGIPCPPY
jgi:hypothetical protein